MSSSVISAHDSSPPASWLCSQGHASTEADFCSECGLKIAIAPDSSPDPSPDPTLKPASGAGNPNVSAHTRANTGDQENARDSANRVCPDCGGQHQMDWGSFCEGCGYNFTLGVSSETGLTNGATGLQSMGIELPVAEATGAESAITELAITEPEPGPVEREATQAEGWAIAITLDPSLWDVAISPAPPELSVEPVLLLVRPEGDRPFLIGRTSQTQAIYPDIALDFDNAVPSATPS
ncbi:MAG: hypothetical protein HC771_04690 [Synechococcales cyanobacterium CRU_2_2]|nr:hypothetical protein [Synechococcales cyanobacterium CRU_2_2]